MTRFSVPAFIFLLTACGPSQGGVASAYVPRSGGKAEGRKFQGRNYDLYFEWSDDRMYCSELVWKIYYRALGIEIGKTQMLGDFDLSDPAVIRKMKGRWSGSIPLNETVISPAAMFESVQLITVYSH